VDAATVVLQDSTIVLNTDITTYSMSGCRFTLNFAAMQKIEVLSDGTPFAVTVSKEVIAYSIFKPIFSNSFCEKISGKVTDNNNKPLQSFTVSLLQAKDRSLEKAAVTAANGGFEFTSKKESSFLLSYSQVWF